MPDKYPENAMPRLILVFLLLLCACSDQESAVRVDMTKVENIVPPGRGEAVTYAYLPQYSHAVSFRRHHLLVEYLRRATGLNIRQVFPATFGEHIAMVERGDIDISFTNPFVYISLEKSGSRAFARIVEPESGADFSGQIIVRADNAAIRRLEDCRDKRLIAVDPDSAGGYLYPLGLFDEHGISRSDFREISFAPDAGGKQESVVLAVYAGVRDVGTIRKGTLDIVRDRIDVGQIRVLAETRPYPGWLYSARKGLDPAVVDSVRRALLALDPDRAEDARILEAAGMIRIIESREGDYVPVRELVRRLGLHRDAP